MADDRRILVSNGVEQLELVIRSGTELRAGVAGATAEPIDRSVVESRDAEPWYGWAIRALLLMQGVGPDLGQLPEVLDLRPLGSTPLERGPEGDGEEIEARTRAAEAILDTHRSGAVQAVLAHHPDPTVRCVVAGLRQISPQIDEQLGADDAYQVRMALELGRMRRGRADVDPFVKTFVARLAAESEDIARRFGLTSS